MYVKKNFMLWLAVFALTLPLMLVGTASARFASDGAVPDGVTGGWKAPTDGVCVVSVAPNGDMVIDATITNYRDCMAKLVDVTATAANGSLSTACTTTLGNTAGVKYGAAGSNTCVTIDASGYITGSLTLKDMDKNAVMCNVLGGQLASAVSSTVPLLNGALISTSTRTTANGTSAKCIPYGWNYKGQDAAGTPLAFGSKGTLASANAGFCYTSMRTNITPTTSCPSATQTDPRQKLGYSTSGAYCLQANGVTGPINTAVTSLDGTVRAAGSTQDLTAFTTMGECIAAGFSWNNWVPKDGTSVANGITMATFDHNNRTSGSDREGCLHCHGLDQSRSATERFKQSYLKTGHKNMLRKVTAGMKMAGPDGVMYDTLGYAAGSIDFGTLGNNDATATVGGVAKPLLYLFGDWMAAAPGGLDVVVDMGGALGAKYNGGSNYSCAACHTTGWSNASAGLCSISSNTTSAACTTAGGTWVQSTGAEGVVGREPQASFPSVTFTGTGNWDLDGIQCTRCHGSAYPTPNALPATEVPVGGHQNSIWDDGGKINNLCYGCHQSPAKTSNGNGADVDTANPQNIPVKLVSSPSGTLREFNGHVLGNSFLNSPHARFTGTITPNLVSKWSISSGTYGSTFKGYACYQGPTSTSAGLSKGDGTFIETKAECDALYGAGSWKAELSADAGTATGGNCTTCHDVHNSLFVEGQTHHPLRRECETCHEDTAGKGYAAAAVPQITNNMNHPRGANTPWDTAQFVNACETCHMPKATDGGFPMHLWRINTSATYSTFPSVAEFNAGMKIGKAADDNGYASAVWVDVDLACGQCHGGSAGSGATKNAPYFAKSFLSSMANGMHDAPPASSPTVKFSMQTSPIINFKVRFDASASICPTGPCQSSDYAWDFGDGAIASGATPTHTYADATPLTVTLTLTGGASKAKTVTPVYVASSPTTLTGLSVTPGGFTPTINWTVGGGVAPYKVRVNFGDGTTVAVTQPAAGAGSLAHTYSTSGTFHASVYAVDSGDANGNNKTSTTQYINVTIAPSASTVSGLVLTSTGTPVSGAAVTLGIGMPPARVIKYLTYTNASGAYTFSGVMDNTYTLKAAKSGVTFPAPVSITTSGVFSAPTITAIAP